MVVAAKNAQAKSISPEQVRARTLHGAALLGVQALTNSNMAADSKQQALQQLWSSVRVLVVEEIIQYARLSCHAGPGCYVQSDFSRMLRSTAQVSLLDDLDAKGEDGNSVYIDVPAEVQHAQNCLAPYLMFLSFAGRCVSSRAIH